MRARLGATGVALALGAVSLSAAAALGAQEGRATGVMFAGTPKAHIMFTPEM